LPKSKPINLFNPFSSFFVEDLMSIHIKILGPGCVNCERVEANVRAAVTQTGVDAIIDKVTDYASFIRYGLLFTPGLVINEKLVAGGRIPSVAEISSWLTSAIMADQV
jgi:small redox-active disulfide protein 2